MTLLSSAYLIDRASATVSASMLPTELVSGTSFPFINDRHIISESFLSIHFHTFTSRHVSENLSHNRNVITGVN